MKKAFIACILCFLFISANAQLNTSNASTKFRANTVLTPADSLNKTRFWALTGGIAGLYGGTLILLNEYWYKHYKRSSFHFFDDSREWLQMDKAGHLFNAYFISNWGLQTYRWTGLDEKGSAIAGSIAGSFLLTAIELLDGYSAKWGASLTDLSANIAGSGVMVGQHLLWEEQRISIKISAFPIDYPKDVQQRTYDLYGNTIAETVLKDYNAITFWASGNIYSFLPEQSKFPKWLSIAVGYGAHGLYGGYENRWCSHPDHDMATCPSGSIVDRTDIPRIRQFYLSPDVDLTRIKTNSKLVNTLLFMANAIKIPAPALEWSNKGELIFHPVFF